MQRYLRFLASGDTFLRLKSLFLRKIVLYLTREKAAIHEV